MTVSEPHGPSIRRALVTVFLSRYTNLGINFTAMILLARLLPPAETGLFSLVVSLVSIAQALRDFGVAEFLVQERDLTSSKIRTALGMTMILSWSLGGILFLARGFIADIYHTPALSGLIVIATCSFAAAPFSSTIMAILNREMAFGALLRISLISTITNQGVSIVLAVLGYGAASLVYGLLAANVITAVAASLTLRSRDHLIPSLREWRTLASFGSFISAANIVDQFGGRAPDLIIARVTGYQALGLFNRAIGVVGLFTNLVIAGVQAVAFPMFSNAHRRGEGLREPYLYTVTLITGVMFPVLAVLASVSGPLVATLLGQAWMVSASLVPLLCIGAACDSLAPMVVPLLNASGRVNMTLNIALMIRGAQLLLVCCFAGLGLMWLATGQVILGLIALMVNVRYLNRAIQVGLIDLLRAASRSAGVTVLTAIPPLLLILLRADAHDPQWASLIAGASAGGIGWLVAILLLRHPIGREFLKLMREMRILAGRPAV